MQLFYQHLTVILFLILFAVGASAQTPRGSGTTAAGSATEQPPDSSVYTQPSFDPEVLSRLLVYPAVARNNGIEGRVVVKFVVGADSTAQQIEVIESSSILFNKSAIEAIRRTPFVPATKDRVPVPVWMSIPLTYALSDPSGELADDTPQPDSLPRYDRANLARMVSYPELARANGIEGKVVIAVLINEKGKVEQTRIVSSDSKLFDEAALKVIHQVLFVPAMRDGRPTAAWVTVPVSFSLGK